MPAISWQQSGQVARLHINDFSATVHLARPYDGLTEFVIADQRLANTHLLGVAASSITQAAVDPVEAYVRGADLVVAYEASGLGPVRVDALWRATAPTTADSFIAALDLIVSVHTGLLDSHPELPAQSTLPQTEVLRLQKLAPTRWTPLASTCSAPIAIGPENGTGCLLFRIPDTDLSYVEMIHPADFERDELSHDKSGGNTLHIAHRLFCTHLEKGVILRSRIRGILLHRQADTDIAAQCYAAFAAGDPPLGT
jgi:hypothetical protein